MTRPCKIGIQLPEVERRVEWDELLAMARSAEAVGFDSLWLGDHLLYDLPDVGTRGPWEVWTSLAALAVATERVELGPLVASAGFHQPTMLAKQAATIDAISGGRLIVGLGAGWNEREYTAFGFPYDRRVDRFAEAFTIIRTLLRDGHIDFDGEFYTAVDCVIDPNLLFVEGLYSLMSDGSLLVELRTLGRRVPDYDFILYCVVQDCGQMGDRGFDRCLCQTFLH